MKQKLKTRNIISDTVLNLIQIQNLDLSEYLLIDYPNYKDFRLYILQYKKESDKKIYFGSFFFHWLDKEKKSKKFFIGISKFD